MGISNMKGKIFLLVILTAGLIFSQQVYKIPFASKDNSIELSVVNKSTEEVKDVKVEATDIPKWINIDEGKKIIPQIKPNEEGLAVFTFSVEKEAAVNKETKLSFNVVSKSGEVWKKEITISVLPPEKFELYQNYPNPFNPLTTISFVIPNSSFIILKVFDVIGSEVATLINEMKEPGFHSVKWNGSDNSSGMYIYQVRAKSADGNETIERKKMMLIK
jgi:hypothetical protein